MHALAALRILLEELAKMAFLDLLVVRLQGLVRRTIGQHHAQFIAWREACWQAKAPAALTLQPHLRQPVAQRVAGQPQQPRGLALVAVGAPQRFPDDVLLVLIQASCLPAGNGHRRLRRAAAARSPA